MPAVIMPPRPANIRPRNELQLPTYRILSLLEMNPRRLDDEEQNMTLRGGEGPTGWKSWRVGDETDPVRETWVIDDTLVDSDVLSEHKSATTRACGPDGDMSVCGLSFLQGTRKRSSHAH